MNGGKLGCILSHVALWKMLVLQEEDGLVFEDDVLLENWASAAFHGELPWDWQAIWWGYTFHRKEDERPPSEKLSRSASGWENFIAVNRPPLACHCYSLKWRTAEFLLKHVTLAAPIDSQMQVLLGDQRAGLYIYNDDTMARQRSAIYPASGTCTTPVTEGLYRSLTS